MPPPRMVRKLIILSFLLKSCLISANTFIPDSRVIRDEWIKSQSNSTDYQDYLEDFFSVQENLHSSDDEITEQATELNNNGRFMQRELNRWSQFSEQKLSFFFKCENLKNVFNKRFGMAVIIYY